MKASNAVARVDEIITEVSREWGTGKWTSISIAIGKWSGIESLGFVPCASRVAGDGLENGKARQGLNKAIKDGLIPVGIIAMEEGKQHFLPLAGSGFSVGRDPETGEESFERTVWTGKPSQYH